MFSCNGTKNKNIIEMQLHDNTIEKSKQSQIYSLHQHRAYLYLFKKIKFLSFFSCNLKHS